MRFGRCLAFYLASGLLGGCGSDAGRFEVRLDIPAEANRWVWLRVAPASGGRAFREVGPFRVRPNLTAQLPAVPHGRRLVLEGEHRNVPWQNAAATHRARTAPFDFEAGDNLRIVARFEPVTEDDGAAPAGPQMDRIMHLRTPWGLSAAPERAPDLAEGGPGSVPPRSVVVVYDGTDVETAVELAQTVGGPDGTFRVEVGEGLEAPSRIYVAISPDGRSLSDSSTVAGIQAALIRNGRWVARFRTREPGQDFRNPNRLLRVPRTGSTLEDDSNGAQEPSDIELRRFHPEGTQPAAPLEAVHGFRWRELAFDRPELGQATVAVFDPVRGQTVVLNGGLGLASGEDVGETWTWDGLTWRAVDATRLPTESGHRLAFHDGLREVMLFGGSNPEGEASDEVFTFDGEDWTRFEVEGAERPAPRVGHGMAYDSVRERLVVFGGCPDARNLDDNQDTLCDVPALGDTWELAGRRWIRREDGPPAKEEVNLVYDPVRRRSYLMGGGSSEVWSWDGAQWRREADVPTPHTTLASATWDAVNERVLFYEGVDQVGLEPNRLFAFDGQAWSPVPNPPAAPSPGIRVNPQIVFDPLREEALLLGGSPLEDRLWRFTDGWRATQRAIETFLPERDASSAAYDARRQRWVVFGGLDFSTVQSTDQLWEFDGVTWYPVARREPWPPPRGQAQAAYDPVGGHFVMTGGVREDGVVDDGTWLWDGETWTQLATTTGGRAFGVAAYDEVREEIVLYGGGFAQTTPGAEATQIYRTGRGWAPQTSQPAPIRALGSAMTFDPARRRVVLAGGQTRDDPPRYLDQVWSWDGTRWQPEPRLPQARAFGTLVFDLSRNRLVYHGGEGASRPDTPLATLYELPSGANQWVTVMPREGTVGAPAVLRHMATFFPPLGEMITAGGTSFRPLSPTLRWNGRRWDELDSAPTLGPRCFHSAARAGQEASSWVTAGCTIRDCSVRVSSTWRWIDGEWRRLGSSRLEPRVSDGVMVPGQNSSAAVLIAGLTSAREASELSFEVGPGGWQPLGTGLALSGMAGALFEPAGPTYLFGGQDQRGASSELFQWDRRGPPVRAAASGGMPSPRFGHAAVYEPGRSSMVIHGGGVPTGSLPTVLGDTWRLTADGQGNLQWTEVARGPPRFDATLVHEPVGGRTFLFGGTDGRVIRGDLHQFDRNAWRRIDVDGARPSGRFGHVALYDPSLEAMVVHGGALLDVPTERCSDETWVLPLSTDSRPAVRAVFRFDLASVERAEVRSLQLRANAGGQAPGFGPQPVRGAEVEGWSHRSSRWVVLGMVDSDPNNLGAFSIERTGALARELIGSEGRIFVRVRPSGGVGQGTEPTGVRVEDLELFVNYQREGDGEARCGNGRVEAFSGESCDDGNQDPTDGCSPDCAQEANFRCSLEDPSVCRPVNP